MEIEGKDANVGAMLAENRQDKSEILCVQSGLWFFLFLLKNQ